MTIFMQVADEPVAAEPMTANSEAALSQSVSTQVSYRISKDKTIPGQVLSAFEIEAVPTKDEPCRFSVRLLCLEIVLMRCQNVEKDLKARYAYNLQENTTEASDAKKVWERKKTCEMTEFEAAQTEQPKLFYQIFSKDIAETEAVPRTGQGEFQKDVDNLSPEKKQQVAKLLNEFNVLDGCKSVVGEGGPNTCTRCVVTLWRGFVLWRPNSG